MGQTRRGGHCQYFRAYLFWYNLQEQCMNNRIVCVLQENVNILRNYICYYRYKQGISNVLKYVFTQGLVSL